MENSIFSNTFPSDPETFNCAPAWKAVQQKLDAILNNKSETFEKKVQSLIEVWKSVSELDFSQFDIQHIIRIIDWAKLHALDIVLTGKWRQTKDCFCDNLVKYIEKAQAGLASCNSAFSSRCQKLADVVRRPWEHPVLNNLINHKDAEIGPEEIEFFCVETIYLVSVRLKKLCENRCEDLALNLSTNYLKYKKQATLQNMNLNATDTQLWFIFDIHIALLYKFQDKRNIDREFNELSLQEGVQLIKRFTKKRVKIAKIWCNFEKIAMYGCRYFISKAVTCDGDEHLKETLRDVLKTYLTLSNTESLLEEFMESISNLTKLADAEGLCVMCEVIHREGSAKMFPFAIEMYIRALTTDMNEMERLKQTDEVDKIKSTTSRLAQSFTDLGDLLDHEVKVARETVLTAFSIQPTRYRLNRIIDLARRSGYEVLDTGQEEWKCRLHPPVLPSDDLVWTCPECGEWMCKPVLTAPPLINVPLQEAMQECLLDIPLAVRDDLVVCLSNPRYQVLSWVLAWNDLHRLCIFYLNDPEKTKNFVTELKFIDIDYSKFDHIKREPVDEYSGIEKGYEQYLDSNFNPEQDKSTVSDDDSISPDGSDENGDNSSLSQTTSNPNTLKSLRMYRPNLKRKKIDSKIPIQENTTQATQSPSESKVARITPTGSQSPSESFARITPARSQSPSESKVARITPNSSQSPSESKVARITPTSSQSPLESKVARITPTSSNMTSMSSFSGYELESLLATSSSQILSCAKSRNPMPTATNFGQDINGGQTTTPVKLKKKKSTQSSASTSHTALNTKFNDSLVKINVDTKKQNITNPKNVIAATLPQLGGQVAQKQLSQVPYQHQSHKVDQTKLQPTSSQSGTIAACKMKPKDYCKSESPNLNGNSLEQIEKGNPLTLPGLDLRIPSSSDCNQDHRLAAQMKVLKVQITPLEYSQLPKLKPLTTKERLTHLPSPCSLMKQGFPQTVLESPVPAPITTNLIPDFQQTPWVKKTLRIKLKRSSTKLNILASMKPAKVLVVRLQKLPEMEALLAATLKISKTELNVLSPIAKSTKIFNTEPTIPILQSMTISNTELDTLLPAPKSVPTPNTKQATLLPTPKSTTICSTEQNTLLPAPKSITTSKTELDVPTACERALLLAATSPILPTIELNTLLPTPESTTMSKTELDVPTACERALLLAATSPILPTIELNTLLPTPESTTMSKTELDVPTACERALLLAATSPILPTIELNTLLPTPESTTMSKTEVDLTTISNTELATSTAIDLMSSPELDILTTPFTEIKTIANSTVESRIPELDLQLKTTSELEAKTESTTELSVLTMSTTKLDNQTTSSTEVDLLDVLTTSKTDLDFPTTSKTELDFLTSLKTELEAPTLSKTGLDVLTMYEAEQKTLTMRASELPTSPTPISPTPILPSLTCPRSAMSHGNDLPTTTSSTTESNIQVNVPVQTCSPLIQAASEMVDPSWDDLSLKSTPAPKVQAYASTTTCKIQTGVPQLTSEETTSSTKIIHTDAAQMQSSKNYSVADLDVLSPKKVTLATCTSAETLAIYTTPDTLEKTPEASLLTEATYPQARVQVQHKKLSKFSTTQESPTLVRPANSLQLSKIRIISDEMMKILLPCASINQGVCRASVKSEQIQEAPIVLQKIYGACKEPYQVYTIPASNVRFDKDKVLDCYKKTDIQSTRNERDMASDKIGTNNKTVKIAYVTIINGADNCSTINNVNKNLNCDIDMNVESDLHINFFCEVPLNCDTDSFMSDCTDFHNDLDKGNLKNDDEIMTIVAEESNSSVSQAAIPSKNVAADIITENRNNIVSTSTNVTGAVLKYIPNSSKNVQVNISEDSVPMRDDSGTHGSSTTSEIKVDNLQLLPKYSQAEDEKCLSEFKSHQKFQKTDVLVQHIQSSFGLWDSCKFPKKPKIESLASANEDNYFKSNNNFQSNISVFAKTKNYRNVKLEISWDSEFESWALWKWQKSNLKMYSNNRKRKHDSVPCFKFDNEKMDCKPFSVDLQRLPNQISSAKANGIIANPEYSKPAILLNKFVKKTPFNDFTNLNGIGLKKNGYGTLKRMSQPNNKPIQKTRKFIQQFQKIPNAKNPSFISVPGLHDYSEISPRNMTHVVNVVQHGNARSSTVTNSNTQTSTQVTPHIQRIGQAKLDRKPEHYDVDPEPSSSAVMSAPSTSQSTLINILSSPKTSQKSTQSRQTPIVNILSQQIYMPSLDQQTATVIKVEPEDHADVQATKTVNTNVRIVTTTTQAGATPTTSTPAQGGAILQFICKSSSLPKFQQAFGKAVYQTGTTAEVGTSETPAASSEVTNQAQTATVVETKKIAAKTVPVNVQPITGNVIFRGQVPIGQTVSLIPPGSTTRQLFRITGSTHEQISLVKETVIQNKMSALLAAALQGKPKITEQNGELVEEYSATRITLCRPGSVPPNATRIVKPVQLQIPANVIRAPQPNVSSTTLEQLREFDMVYKQVKERSSNPVQPEATPQTTPESPQQRISFTYVNQVQKYTQLSPVVVVSSYSPIQQTVSPAVSVTSQSGSGSGVTQVSTVAVPKVAVKSSKGKTIKSSVVKTSPTTSVPTIPKPQQKPQEDEHTTQRIFDILAEYAEQLRNSPDLNNKPAPRRRSNPPTNPSSNTSSSPSKKKKKKSTSSSTSNLVETDNEDLTMGSEDSSGGNAVHLSMTDEEQSQSASITPPESNLEPATLNNATPRPLIVTDTSSQPRNVIIADSSVGEALKIPNTALLMPGNYIMPVSVVKGGQQIAVVSAGSKILTTVPARSGQNMLLLQSFVNQNKKGGISAVKYSTLQPFSTISQNVTTVTAQTSVVLPSNSVSSVSLKQPITLKKIDDNERGNSTELLLTISQPRESVKVDNTEVPQPDSSTNLLPCEAIEVKIEEASSSHLSNNEVYNNIQEPNSVATSVIASVIKKDDDETQTGDSSMKGAGTLRTTSVLVNTSTSNGPMLSHTNTRYRKSTEGVESTSASTKPFNHNMTKVPQATARILKNNTVYYAIRTKKAVSQKIDSEMQKQAAIERELRLQKTLSEECEDLGVDEPSTSDLFPEADLLFDSNHSPSYDQLGQKIQGTEAKTKGSLHLFSDDENSEPLRNDLFDYVEYHPPEPGIDQVNGNSISNESASSCDDSTLLPNCGSMSEVTLNSPISLDYTDNSHKYKYKYTNRKKGGKFNRVDNWQEVTEVTSSEDAMEIIKGDDTPIAIQEETVINESLTEVEADEMENPKNSEADTASRCPIHHSIDKKDNSRKALKKICLCFNGTSKIPNTASTKRRFSSQGPTSCKKVLINKKR